MRLLCRFLPVLVAIVLVAGAPGRAHALPGVYWPGGQVFARFIFSEAAYDNNLYLWNKAGGEDLFLFDNRTGAAAGDVRFAPAGYGYTPGDFLVFSTRVFGTRAGTDGETAGRPAFTWYTVQEMNSDGATHADIFRSAAGLPVAAVPGRVYNWRMNWEDMPASEWRGPEGDFDDMEVGVSVTPEPLSLALLGTGLAGLAGIRRRRRSDDS